jgi:hypothetical protein
MFRLLKGTVAQSVVVSINVSLKTSITEGVLLDMFQSDRSVTKQWVQHISAFYSEMPSDIIKAFIKEYNISKASFNEVHNQLPDFFKYSKYSELLKEVFEDELVKAS